MAITFDHIINMTQQQGNPDPTYVGSLMIANETDNTLNQFYIDNDVVSDKSVIIEQSSYDNLQWDGPHHNITNNAVKRIGIKSFPQFGSMAFYNMLYEERSKILCPVFVKSTRYTAPSLSFTRDDDTITFTMTSPKDITYICWRIVMRVDYNAFEYVSYEDTLTIDNPYISGNYECYCVGYTGEGEMVSDDSEHIFIDIIGRGENPLVNADEHIASATLDKDNHLVLTTNMNREVVSDVPISGGGTSEVFLRNAGTFEVRSSTALSGSIACSSGDLIVAVLVHRSAITNIPDGWTLLYTTSNIMSTVQYISVLYTTAESESISMTFNQSNADRMYLNLHAIANGDAPSMLITDGSLTGSFYENPLEVTKTTTNFVIWAVHKSTWVNTSPYPIWTSDLPIIQLGNVTQSRLATFIDAYMPATHTISFSATQSEDTIQYIAINIPVANGEITPEEVDTIWSEVFEEV